MTLAPGFRLGPYEIGLELGASRPLFGGQPMKPGAMSRDGRRFLSVVPLEEAKAPPLTLVTNWPAELTRR